MTMFLDPTADIPIQRGWTKDEMLDEFEVLGFMAPYVVVKSKIDGVKGTLVWDMIEVDGRPVRIYHSFEEE